MLNIFIPKYLFSTPVLIKAKQLLHDKENFFFNFYKFRNTKGLPLNFFNMPSLPDSSLPRFLLLAVTQQTQLQVWCNM